MVPPAPGEAVVAGAEGTLCYDRSTMERLLDALTSVEIEPIAIVDIVLTALLFYWLFSLIRGTRAVRLVIGVISLSSSSSSLSCVARSSA